MTDHPGTDPSVYVWNACHLTRNLIRKGDSHKMTELLERLAIWHMKGQKECRTGYITKTGIDISIARRSDPPRGFIDIQTMLDSVGKHKSYVPDIPEREVDIVTTISGPGDPPTWNINHKKLLILQPPESLLTRILSGRAILGDIITGPYLDGFEIDSVWWKKQQWKAGEAIGIHNSPTDQGRHIEIMLRSDGDDFQPIKIETL